MCILNSEDERSTRTRTTFANLSLAVGLILWVFVHPNSAAWESPVHFASGLLLGVSIAVRLKMRYSSRRTV